MTFLSPDLGTLRHWIEMSILMMLPISIAIGRQIGITKNNFIQSQFGFLFSWIIISYPVTLLSNLKISLDSNLFVVTIWILTGIYQFSQLHEHFVNSCRLTISTPGFKQGFAVGLGCLRACGPLMIAAFMTFPMSLAIMFGLTILMLMEFVSHKGLVVSRAIGLASILFAAGTLFLTTSVQSNVPDNHNHHLSGW